MPGLMDMGAQVFIIEKRVFEERFPNTKIKSAEDLLVDIDKFEYNRETRIQRSCGIGNHT